MFSEMLNVRDLPYRIRCFQLSGEGLKMCGTERRLLFILLVGLCMWIFSCRIAASDASSGPRVALDSEDVLIDGKQHLADFSTALWVRGLKQAVAAPTPDGSNIYFILAEHRTRRPDILQKFKFYEGGWNITSKHYWASVGFTGAPAFILAVLWFIAFGFALLVLCCCGRWIEGACEGLHSCWVSLLLLIVFTCAAIVGCILLSMGQDKFHHKISHTLDFVVHQSEFTVGNLRNITEYLAHAKTISVDQHFIPPVDKQKIDELNKDLNEAANELQAKTADNADKIRKALTAVRDALIVVAGVMLLIAVLGFLMSVLGFRHIIYILVIIGWLLVVGTFILCGVFIVLNNAISDTCTAMEEWVEYSPSEPALEHILPCINGTTSNLTLYQNKEITSHLVNVVNKVIRNVANENFAPLSSPLYYNQSGPLMPLLCNPFDSKLNDRQCSPQEENFTSAPQVWQNYICTVSDFDICVTPGRITVDIYNQLVAAVNVSYGLYIYTPFLLNLTNCTFVRETFRTIGQHYCPELQLYIKWVYIGLALVSPGVMLSLIFWIINTREKGHKNEYFQPVGVKMMDNMSMEMASRVKASE